MPREKDVDGRSTKNARARWMNPATARNRLGCFCDRWMVCNRRTVGPTESEYLGNELREKRYRLVDDPLLPAAASDDRIRRRVRRVLRSRNISPNVNVNGERSKTTCCHVRRCQCSDVVVFVGWHAHRRGRIFCRCVTGFPVSERQCDRRNESVNNTGVRLTTS